MIKRDIKIMKLMNWIIFETKKSKWVKIIPSVSKMEKYVGFCLQVAKSYNYLSTYRKIIMIYMKDLLETIIYLKILYYIFRSVWKNGWGKYIKEQLHVKCFILYIVTLVKIRKVSDEGDDDFLSNYIQFFK